MGIREELLAIEKTADGKMVCEMAVEWARENPDSALHQSLEWDDTKAGEEYRKWQVRRLVAIHIVSPDTGERQLVSLSIDRTNKGGGGGYRDMKDVLRSPELHQVLLDDALKELQRVQAKWQQLKELKPIWDATQKIRRKHRKKGKEGPEHIAA